MKKTMKTALMRFKEAIASGTESLEIPFGEDVVDKFDRWIDSRGYCSTDESMQDLSERLGIPRYELTWVCRSVYGYNFPTLRKRLRIMEAENLLIEEPETPICVIGERVGIPDRSNFRRQFFEIHGMTPQEWRDNW